jgi:hypothetical protein
LLQLAAANHNWGTSATTLKNKLSRRPFEPFRVVLSSGDSYEVRHPEFAWLFRGGLYIGLPPEGSDLPDHEVFCSMLNIAAVESVAGASPQ